MQRRCRSSERGKPGATPLSQGACRAHVSRVKGKDPGVEAAAFRGERRVEGGAWSGEQDGGGKGVSQRQASACGDEFCVTGDFALSLLLRGDFNQLP